MSEKGGSASTLNLDLSNVSDPDELASSIETFYKNDSMVKTQLAWAWERNHMMLDGKQWLVYEGNQATGGMWRPLQVSRENEYIPRPVTNLMFDAYQTLKGYLLKTKPRISVRPNSSSNKDKSAAKLSTLVSETNYERLHEDQNYEYAASVGITYGTVFKKSYWDNSYVSQVKVPRMVQQPQTDPMTGQVTGMIEVQEQDPATGELIFDTLPLGDVNTDVVEPYRMALDPLASDMHKLRWLMEYSIQPLDWIRTTYGKDAEGYTGRIDEVKPETQLNNSMRRFFQLKTSSGTRTGVLQSSSGMGSESYIENTAIVKEYYERPSEQYPKGRLIVVANGIPLYIGESPCDGPDLGDWHPYSEYRWEIVPGRFWGKSPLDDGAEIQKKINSIDATIILTRKTMAIPQWIIPIGIGVEPGSITGQPGQNHFYRNDGTGAKPEKVMSAGAHESVFTERETAVNDFKQVTGAIDILKGDRPPGVTAASALSMLYEVGTGKLFPTLGRFKAFIESDQKKQLRCISKHYQEPRPEFIAMLKAKNSDISEQEIDNFIGDDLYDNCNVVIEAGSNVPKLKAAEQALLLEVAQTGALTIEVPTNRAVFLERLGITGFDTEISADVKRAEWENDLLDDIMHSPDNAPVVLLCDKDEVHIDVHEKRMKEPSFMSLPLQIQQAYMQHTEEHHSAMQAKMQYQAMQQAAMGMAPQPGQQTQPGQPDTNLQPSGNGITAKQKEAVFSDALVPGQAKPTK